MIAMNDSRIDVTKLEMADIIDAKVLQNFLDNFAIGFNCAAVSVGRNGEEFTRPSHYRPFCSNYIHASQIGDHRCADCHNEFGRKAIARNGPYVGACHAGLIDFSAPVIIMGEHIGTVLGGQILNSPPNEAAIRKVAGEINTDANGLWNAAQSIDIVPGKNIEAAAEVLYIVVNAMAQSGFNKIETDILSSNLARNFIQLSETINILAENSQDIVSHQSEVVAEIQQIEQHISEITGVLKSVNKIADQTKILGINASIEAAHLGMSGKGFAVVAEEIRKLSESTKQTVGKVGVINETVERSITSTMKSANSTLDITSNQSASMEELSATVQSSVSLAERLRELFGEAVK